MVSMKLLFALLFISGCSLYFGKDEPKTAKGSRYSIPFSLPYWDYQKDKRSDYVFQNKDGRILLSNSFCEEFQEQPLARLATKTFKTINDFVPRISEYTTFKNREAYRIEGTGKVDGVTVNLRLLNTRRDNCYFDFLSINPEMTKETDNAFELFLQAVSFK